MKKLIITENTKRTLFKIAGSPVVVGQAYDLVLQSTIEIENTLGYPSEPLDDFKYKIEDDDIHSINEGIVQISFIVDKSTLPELYNLIQTISIFDSFKFSDLIPPSLNYDRIIITELIGKGIWLLNNNQIGVGQVIFYYQLKDVFIFTASDTGSQENYNILKFKFGHIQSYYPDENSIIVNAISLTQLLLNNPDQTPELDETIETTDFDVLIYNGPVSAAFEIEIDTTLFVGIGTTPENKLIISNNDIITTYNTSGVFIYPGTLSEQGDLNLDVSIKKLYPYTTPSSIKMNLISVNTTDESIDPIKKDITLNIPISIIT